jgi:cellulose synthase/poly-beta-1,6-N-acetylglucosamine synthase-like glycosyltransferase
MSIVVVYLLIYTLYLLGFLWGGWVRLRRKNSLVNQENSIGLTNITVIIPFRNEEKRISLLLESIKQSEFLPHEIIFVDDHSEDETQLLLEQVRNKSITLISLGNEVGKKRAIEKGVNFAKTNFILTLDADVNFSPSYFTNLGNLTYSDLHILPVKHWTVSFFNRFLQQDVLFADLLNKSIAGWIRPIFCSGANLLVKKESFLEAINQTSYFEFDSGDDVFLLREFQRRNKKIKIHIDSNLEVQTELPITFEESIHQRMRWLGKSLKVGDRLANSLAILQFLFSLMNIGFLIGIFILLPIKFAFTLILLKTLLELLFSFDYYRKSNQLALWLTIPFYLLILPFINGIMAFAFLGFKPKWKGRLVVQ